MKPARRAGSKQGTGTVNIVAPAIALALLISLPALGELFGNKPSSRPRLVVQITVDQLRGDLPMRYRERLPKGGFRYLLEEGTHYANAHYRHANTETAVGHALLEFPGAHGKTAEEKKGTMTPSGPRSSFGRSKASVV